MRFPRFPAAGVATLTLLSFLSVPSGSEETGHASVRSRAVVSSAPLPLQAQSVRAGKVFYGPPAPPPVYGPPLPPEREQTRRQAARLLEHLCAGRLKLTMPERDREQLERLAAAGLYRWPAPTPDILTSGSYQALLPDAPVMTARVSLPSRRLGSSRRSLPLDADDETPDAPSPEPILETPHPALLRMLEALAARSNAGRPLELLSLLRPPYRTGYWRHGGPTTMHSQGMAADIAAYNGHRIRQDRPEECVGMALALLRDLPPGRYRLGMPKAPESPLVVGQPYLPPGFTTLLTLLAPPEIPLPLALLESTPSKPAPVREASPLRSPAVGPPPGLGVTGPAAGTADLVGGGLIGVAVGLYLGQPASAWPFFPAPEPEVIAGLVAPRRLNGKVVRDGSGRPLPNIVRFRNVAYAPAEALADSRLRKALDAARQRGVAIVGLFPDGVDHIHIDVKPER